MDITAKAYPVSGQQAYMGREAVPAGWALKSPETGKQLSSLRFATEEDAMAAASWVLAQYTARLEAQAAPVAQSTTDEPRRYRQVRNSHFGPGRVYSDQPGATQYDDGSGTYRVQIWDN